MKALVTGGLGFIGARMCQRLLDDGYEVVVLDNAVHGSLKRKINHPKIIYHLVDICDYDKTRPFYNDVDYVFHFAAVSRMPQCESYPLDAVRVNYLGTATVLQCASEANVKWLVNSSTSAVYGDLLSPLHPKQKSKPESYKNPISQYAITKLNAEHLCDHYYKHKGLNVTSLRYFNVYGPGEDMYGAYAQVVALFVDAYTHDTNLIVYGNGQQERDFVHVDDVVEANMRSINNDFANGLSLNVGTSETWTVNELTSLFYTEDRITYVAARNGDPLYTCADMQFSSDVLGFKPSVLKLGDYIKEQIQRADSNPLSFKNQKMSFSENNK